MSWVRYEVDVERSQPRDCEWEHRWDIKEGREPVDVNVKTRLKVILRTIVYTDKKRGI